jgi:hypothetical protein
MRKILFFVIIVFSNKVVHSQSTLSPTQIDSLINEEFKNTQYENFFEEIYLVDNNDSLKFGIQYIAKKGTKDLLAIQLNGRNNRFSSYRCWINNGNVIKIMELIKSKSQPEFYLNDNKVVYSTGKFKFGPDIDVVLKVINKFISRFNNNTFINATGYIRTQKS